MSMFIKFAKIIGIVTVCWALVGCAEEADGFELQVLVSEVTVPEVIVEVEPVVPIVPVTVNPAEASVVVTRRMRAPIRTGIHIVLPPYRGLRCRRMINAPIPNRGLRCRRMINAPAPIIDAPDAPIPIWRPIRPARPWRLSQPMQPLPVVNRIHRYSQFPKL